jgi:diaminohydroxyphosphoribosylaminopyrimidine deaminase/5-amino-6-(5-phosphoribosylamino)uracil reductase
MEQYPVDPQKAPTERAPSPVSMASDAAQPSDSESIYHVSAFDRAMMQRCLHLARQALGRTAPNPLVGCVIVKNGRIVGEGFHPGAGHPHAEVRALQAAQERAKGATLYVNLEPCNHYGRTPPCTEAAIAAQVAKVVVGVQDPDPRVSGSGIAKLRSAGIEVVVGVETEDCWQLNEAFWYRTVRGVPLGILKYAMSADGKIATTTGHSAWVTGETARHWVHQLRSSCDAVVVGGNTVRQDNPYLTSHNENLPNPLRVVMSRTLNLPLSAHLWEVERAPTLVLTEPNANPQMQQQLQEMGVEVVEQTPLTPQRVMGYLYERGAMSVLWECGGTLAAQAIAQGAVHKVIAFVAAKLVGGQAAPSPVGDLGILKMTEALPLQNVRWRSLGADYLLEGYLSRTGTPTMETTSRVDRA